MGGSKRLHVNPDISMAMYTMQYWLVPIKFGWKLLKCHGIASPSEIYLPCFKCLSP